MRLALKILVAWWASRRANWECDRMHAAVQELELQTRCAALEACALSAKANGCNRALADLLDQWKKGVTA